METKQASSQQFCGRCGIARSGHGCIASACSNFVEANPRKPVKLRVVEPSPNAMARDAAVILLRSAMTRFWSTERTADIEAALVCLEVIV
jgi:hypothetical protein